MFCWRKCSYTRKGRIQLHTSRSPISVQYHTRSFSIAFAWNLSLHWKNYDINGNCDKKTWNVKWYYCYRLVMWFKSVCCSVGRVQLAFNGMYRLLPIILELWVFLYRWEQAECFDNKISQLRMEIITITLGQSIKSRMLSSGMWWRVGRLVLLCTVVKSDGYC
jgi:hypothetical protein